METILTDSGFKVRLRHIGAELCSLQSPEGTEYIWQAGPEWPRHAPTLFPVVGTLRNDIFTHKGLTYQMPRHGFARDSHFELRHTSGNQAVFYLRANAETLNHYPFEFELQISYKLSANTLFVGYSVQNQGTGKMPFTLGAHPAFLLDGDLTDYALDFNGPDALKIYKLGDGLLLHSSEILALTDGKLPLSDALFESDALVIRDLKNARITLRKNGTKKVRVQADTFPHLGLWKKPGAPFLCIEPWMGHADWVDASEELALKDGIITLEPERVFNTSFAIEVF